jgi:hypothetical protein
MTCLPNEESLLPLFLIAAPGDYFSGSSCLEKGVGFLNLLLSVPAQHNQWPLMDLTFYLKVDRPGT